jgi:hypothetical protein
MNDDDDLIKELYERYQQQEQERHRLKQEIRREIEAEKRLFQRRQWARDELIWSMKQQCNPALDVHWWEISDSTCDMWLARWDEQHAKS